MLFCAGYLFFIVVCVCVDVLGSNELKRFAWQTYI